MQLIYLRSIHKLSSLNVFYAVLQEDGPTIHELAHDDILHNEASQDPIDPANFVNIKMPVNPGATSSHSPIDPTTVQYQVSMEDGDDVETGKIFINNCINSI